MCVYGYCRISTPTQNIERQKRNILKEYSKAILVEEVFTGTKINRTEWNKLYKVVKKGDTIVFDSVSRMSRNTEEGIRTYFDLFDKGINLVFLKEPYINTETYSLNTKDKIELNGTDEDEIFKGLNNYFKRLAKKQIQIAFEQAEKEVKDLRQRTKEGIETARLNGKQIGGKIGVALNVKKKEPIKEKIRKLSKDFEGSNTDIEVLKILGIARNTYYKYKKEIKGGL